MVMVMELMVGGDEGGEDGGEDGLRIPLPGRNPGPKWLQGNGDTS